jgi:hypothetical protein
MFTPPALVIDGPAQTALARIGPSFAFYGPHPLIWGDWSSPALSALPGQMGPVSGHLRPSAPGASPALRLITPLGELALITPRGEFIPISTQGRASKSLHSANLRYLPSGPPALRPSGPPAPSTAPGPVPTSYGAATAPAPHQVQTWKFGPPGPKESA